MTQSPSLLSRALNLMVPLILTGISLFFLPFTQDFYDLPKWTLLALVALIVLIAQAWQFMRTGTIEFHLKSSTVGLGAITLAALVSLLFASTNKVEALLHPFGVVTFLSLSILSISLQTWSDAKSARRILWLFFGSIFILALISLYQFFGFGKFMFPAVLYLADPLWTPTGSATATAALFIVSLPLLIQGILESHKHKQETYMGGLLLVTGLTLAGLGVTLWQIVPKLSSIVLSPIEGWSILLEILKAPTQAFIGVGAENFLTAFTAGRPMRLNATALWNARFLTNTNLLFHLSTIYGLLGLAATAVFLKNFLRGKFKDALSITLLLGFLAILLVPPNISLLIVLIGLLFISESTHASKHVRLPGWLGGIMFTIILLGSIIGGYFLGRIYASEVVFANALEAARRNDGRQAYDLQIKAIQLHPKSSRFHITYSQTNLALAVSVSKIIADTPQATQEDQTANRQLAAQLIQQAIREGKTAIALNPSNILAWENLARTYTQLIGVAQEADTWAITTYKQALIFDPFNPLLTLELGGVYIQMKNYTDAITQFTRATGLKPDYVNAWYNLANAYELSGDTARAREALEKTQSLLEPESNDYRIISEAMEQLENPRTPQKEATESSMLTTPTPAPVVVPPLDLSN
jgi:Flp pilus assembly protein TadD